MKKVIIIGYFATFIALSVLCFNFGAAMTLTKEDKLVIRSDKDQLTLAKVQALGIVVNPALDYYHTYTVKEVYSKHRLTYRVQRDTISSGYVTTPKK